MRLRQFGAGLWHWLRDWRSHAVTLGLVLLVYAVLHAWQTREVPSGAAPAFAATVAASPSRTLTLDGWRQAHEGRAVALYFWADWCPICRLEQDSITRLQADWPVLAVAMQSGDAARVAGVLRQRGLAWTTVVDPDAGIARRYGLSSVPGFVVLDAQGHIRFAEVGYSSETGMRLRLWWAQHF